MADDIQAAFTEVKSEPIWEIGSSAQDNDKTNCDVPLSSMVDFGLHNQSIVLVWMVKMDHGEH